MLQFLLLGLNEEGKGAHYSLLSVYISLWGQRWSMISILMNGRMFRVCYMSGLDCSEKFLTSLHQRRDILSKSL